MKKIIGITGGIACGKSYISSIIKELYPLIDCDEITHMLWKTNQELINKVREVFGEEVYKNGEIDRKTLGKLVFSAEDKLITLNKIIHPIIIDEVYSQIKETDAEVIWLDAPLLYETNLDKICDKVLCVWVEPKIQIQRLMTRNHFSLEEAKNRISKQMPLQIKKEKANYLINTRGTFEETKKILKKIIKEIQNAIKC